jgi:hypothetical protein
MSDSSRELLVILNPRQAAGTFAQLQRVVRVTQIFEPRLALIRDEPGARERAEHVPGVLYVGDGLPDIVGFGDAGVWIARNLGNGAFEAPGLVITNYGYGAGGWRVDNHPRFLAHVAGDARADIVGFGDAGVYISRM